MTPQSDSNRVCATNLVCAWCRSLAVAPVGAGWLLSAREYSISADKSHHRTCCLTTPGTRGDGGNARGMFLQGRVSWSWGRSRHHNSALLSGHGALRATTPQHPDTTAVRVSVRSHNAVGSEVLGGSTGGALGQRGFKVRHSHETGVPYNRTQAYHAPSNSTPTTSVPR